MDPELMLAKKKQDIEERFNKEIEIMVEFAKSEHFKKMKEGAKNENI